jgi:hypothetical protein
MQCYTKVYIYIPFNIISHLRIFYVSGFYLWSFLVIAL